MSIVTTLLCATLLFGTMHLLNEINCFCAIFSCACMVVIVTFSSIMGVAISRNSGSDHAVTAEPKWATSTPTTYYCYSTTRVQHAPLLTTILVSSFGSCGLAWTFEKNSKVFHGCIFDKRRYDDAGHQAGYFDADGVYQGGLPMWHDWTEGYFTCQEVSANGAYCQQWSTERWTINMCHHLEASFGIDAPNVS